jgi:hypothetical protein
LGTEFAKMFFSVLLQVKGVFWRSARDVVVCQCGLPYHIIFTVANVNLMSLAYITSVRVILLVKMADNDITY